MTNLANAQHQAALTPSEHEQQYRSGAYRLLAALLREVPNQALLDHLQGFTTISQQEDELSQAMHQLGLSAQTANIADLEDEYHELFIGLGRGEIVPYGSWYLTGFLMEKPLSQLRDDLVRLGFERNPSVKEPEDHAAALCEVMAMLIEAQQDITLESTFFNQHMNWLPRFFDDLATAPSANFYQAIARFGSAFVAFEQQYFSVQI